MRTMNPAAERALAVAVVLLIGTSGVFCNGCNPKSFWPGAKTSASQTSPSQGGAPITGTLQIGDAAPGPHPRILLTPQRLAALSALKARGADSWTTLLEQCDGATSETITSGYEAWDWANAALALSICARVMNKPDYADRGVKYLAAILDDRYKVGDGEGGDTLVHHDEGYPIRTRGAMAAIVYDWLHDAPKMDDALRKKVISRLVSFTSWFKEKGYNHDEPISNYYMGYFGAVAFGGIACEGEDPAAADLRKQTQEMWNKEIVPKYSAKLAGGDFPEGWQYGDMVGAFLAIYAEAEATAHPGAKPVFADLPWLRDTVAYHAHSLLPDGKHVYDTGDWSDKPALGPPHTLFAIATVFPQDDLASKQARALSKLARDDHAEEWRWLSALADDPSRPSEDPRKGTASYLARGTATMLARTQWTPSAVFVALSSAPSLSDHQHLDAGHFEIVRGSDPLLIDGGGYSAYSSLSHNVVIVDDPAQDPDFEKHKRTDPITYKRNQGTWSDTASIARFEDASGVAYAMADYASAFNPGGYPENTRRAVTRAERELVFSRAKMSGSQGESSRVVVYDRFTVTQPQFTTTFILHGGPAPDLHGNVARFSHDASSAWVTTLLPANVTGSLVDESKNKEQDKAYFNNMPAEDQTSVRLEIPSPSSPSSLERRFLHAIAVGSWAPATGAPAPVRIASEQVDGAALDGEAYVFSSSGPATTASALTYAAPSSATRHIVVDLAPSANYQVIASPAANDTCKITLTPGGARTASGQGMLVFDVVDCALK